MNDVVRKSGMMGFLVKEFVENGDGRFGVGQSGIAFAS